MNPFYSTRSPPAYSSLVHPEVLMADYTDGTNTKRSTDDGLGGSAGGESKIPNMPLSDLRRVLTDLRRHHKRRTLTVNTVLCNGVEAGEFCVRYVRREPLR